MKFTVFTPTFNRAHTLERVYLSLKAQRFRDFEWVIVDDGSTDDTKSLVESFARRQEFPIHYHYQINQGKHIAINHGVVKAAGEFFLIADSDDSFKSDALEIFLDAWNSIPASKRDQFTGVTGLCEDSTGRLIGCGFPSSPFDSNTAENFYRHNIKGEKWGFHRTEVLRQFPFPQDKEHKFFAEGLIWNQISRKYKTRYINHVVRVYHNDAGEQLTAVDIIKRSEHRHNYAYYLNQDIDYLWVAPWKILKLAIQGTRFSCHQKDSIALQLSWIDNTMARLIWLVAMPFGFILYFFENFIKHRRVR